MGVLASDAPAAPGFVVGTALILGIGILLPLAGSYALDYYAADWTWQQGPFHAVMEAAGGVIALTLALLMRMRQAVGGTRHPDVWIGAALAGMGLLDIAHAAVPEGNSFVWLHSTATLVGGLGFTLVWLPPKWTEHGRADGIPVLFALVAAGLAIVALTSSESVPAMLQNGQYSAAARGLNLTGGTLFLVAALRFTLAFKREGSLDSLLFAVLCTLFGAAGLLFATSALWDGPFWWWHGLRLAAYSVAVGYVLIVYRAAQQRVLDLNLELDVANRDLEDRVLRRTQELAEVNRSLREEMGLRETLEQQRWDARLQHSQKLESLGVLAGGIAHDFNNLLVGVMGHTRLVLEELPGDSRFRGPLEQVEAAARRAADLTRQMLDYSGKGRFVVERLDITSLVREMSELVEASISKKATLQPALQDGLPAVQGDETQLRQVVMNLITNASDALEGEPGTIAVRTGLMYATPKELESAVVGADGEPGEYVFLDVADTGRGMDVATRERMFDPFYTTKETGRGLGLAACLGIVRGHGGAIFVDSAPGSGTRVRVLLPAAGDSVITEPVPLAEGDDWHSKGLILVVDDEEIVRGLVAASLQRAGFDVLEAADGRECVDIYQDQGDRIALVILDLTMPRLGGLEALEQMQQINPKVRALLSSGYDARDRVPEVGGNVGIVGFLQKPFGPQELMATVREALGEIDAADE
jgi:signal transduction histidine kinase/ActR/RegA family two-component response regulator